MAINQNRQHESERLGLAGACGVARVDDCGYRGLAIGTCFGVTAFELRRCRHRELIETLPHRG